MSPVGTAEEFFTASGVRLRRRGARPGAFNWLFLPGGPGIGAESLFGLADALDVPGTCWMVDLPGDGSNVSPPGAPASPHDVWPRVLIEAAQALPNCVYLGHSTGGMYLLSVPELESLLVGLVLVSTAPDASWRAPFFEMTQRHPLPEVDAATRRYEAERTDERLRDIAVASAEWNFAPEGVTEGRELLRRMPYNRAAVDWSDRNFDETYVHTWWPRAVPTLIISGSEDRIVQQTRWTQPAFQGPHILHRRVKGAAHFPWIERPQAVAAAMRELVPRMTPRP
ncbi:Pimeloyl-ACP methyl ester carboxylesterase [Myxococcus fulvus]|uniref:Alpha/beta hydrolase n=1 Tax=Myxococcus fulvus TaxID=33 RepID=A0A511SWK1_MYXFU|nr:alpha/beta hydrolase [Myxococcus fulvus]GEN06289.1 alpha/beta hydrolase [Myxococcus fulvus]SET53153.1 Pimeloyl-ACP methyl ester carboxylesterase [Myxococcus fulvus]